MTDTPLLIKVTRSTFAKFLKSFEDSLWKVEGREMPSYLQPVSWDYIMEAIEEYHNYNSLGEEEFLYIYSFEEDPYTIANLVDFENIPLVNEPAMLSKYRVYGHHDFLYFACTEIDASNGEYVNLMIFDKEDDD